MSNTYTSEFFKTKKAAVDFLKSRADLDQNAEIVKSEEGYSFDAELVAIAPTEPVADAPTIEELQAQIKALKAQQKVKKERQIGCKAFLNALFDQVGKTIEYAELLELCPKKEGSSLVSVESTLRTAISDLASPKYSQGYDLMHIVRSVDAQGVVSYTRSEKSLAELRSEKAAERESQKLVAKLAKAAKLQAEIAELNAKLG